MPDNLFGALLAIVVVLALHPPVACAADEQPESADLCAVMADPVAYQHKLIRVTGRVSRGFEDFMLRATSCDDHRPFWLEYGGPTPSETVYCCVSPDADQPNGKDPLSVQRDRNIASCEYRLQAVSTA